MYVEPPVTREISASAAASASSVMPMVTMMTGRAGSCSRARTSSNCSRLMLSGSSFAPSVKMMTLLTARGSYDS